MNFNLSGLTTHTTTLDIAWDVQQIRCNLKKSNVSNNSNPRRDYRLDTLRGLMLIVMTIDHFGGALSRYTYEPFGFVSAAAGFVMLSGYMVACRTGASLSSLDVLFNYSLRRIKVLYRYHVFTVVIIFAVTAISMTYAGYWTKDLLIPGMSRIELALYSLALLHQPTFFDILPLYIFLVLLSPFAIRSFQFGKAKLVFLVSATVWVIGQYIDPHEQVLLLLNIQTRVGFFNLLSWQLIWIIGLYAGFLHGVEGRNNLFQRPVYLWGAACLAIAFMLIKYEVFRLPELFMYYFDKSDMRILRVLNVLALVTLLCHLLRKLPVSTGVPLLSYLGRYSLQVLSCQVLLVYLLMPVTWRIQTYYGLPGEIAMAVAVVAALVGCLKLYQHYALWKKNRRVTQPPLSSSRN